MSLVQLVYASKTTKDLTVDGIKEIVNLAAIKNKGMDISGFLAANFQYFLQCLEGERDAVNRLYRSILNDERHSELSLISFKDIEDRIFPDWNMGVVTHVDLHKKLLALYNGSDAFNPFTLDSTNAVGLLVALSHTRR